jgi:hypothetical protein
LGRLSFCGCSFLGLLTIPNKCCMSCFLIREVEKARRRNVSILYHASGYHIRAASTMDRRQYHGAYRSKSTVM